MYAVELGTLYSNIYGMSLEIINSDFYHKLYNACM